MIFSQKELQPYCMYSYYFLLQKKIVYIIVFRELSVETDFFFFLLINACFDVKILTLHKCHSREFVLLEYFVTFSGI